MLETGLFSHGTKLSADERVAQSVFLMSLVISGPEMYFNSVEDTVSSISYVDLHSPSSLHLSLFLSLDLLMGDVDPAKGMCVGCATAEEETGDGIREARRRLVRRGTLSLKYPEVFFPRNCRSPSFLGSLNGSGYPERIEKLPPLFLSLYLSFSFSYFFSPLLLTKQFIRASASQTVAHYSTTIKLHEFCVRACMRSRGFSRIYYIVHELRIIRNYWTKNW